MTWGGPMMAAWGLINAHAHLAKLRAILQSRPRQHGNDTRRRFPATVWRKNKRTKQKKIAAH